MSQSNMVLPSSGLKFVGEELRNGLNYVGWIQGGWTERHSGKGEGNDASLEQ
jgi:hypothetical protein